ncbi:MAG: histidinol dehydrogenase [Clostridiales Family XIII bacterium]|jgi:histidinol dehydrogenase|nr:histidinol dehydrogenase [Clostridiales Family XIII bacterium]
MIRILQADGKTEYGALDGLAGRGGAPGADVEQAVRRIIADVRAEGDAAVVRYTQQFDGVAGAGIRVLGRGEMKEAFESLPDGLGAALLHAADNIRKYHAKQVAEGYEERRADGVVIGQMVTGLARVGLYVPGGTAAYPSTVLMNAVPAKLAGVGELVMVTPPRDSLAPILGAAYIAGVDKAILAGGAQAVAALACGTETFPRVDKIVGPGNVYVATAKRLLYGAVDIEMIAGPSEILVLADGGERRAGFIAADLLSQAEHDPDAASMLFTTSGALAAAVAEEVERQLKDLTRAEVARKSIDANGIIIVCRSDDEMIALANHAAPEHLELLVEDPLGWLPRIRSAGSVFLGPYTPEPVGDYYAGTNHVLPTSGTARYASPLGVYDFVKRMSYTMYTKEALAAARDDIMAIGEAEGLTAHVAAVRRRFEE